MDIFPQFKFHFEAQKNDFSIHISTYFYLLYFLSYKQKCLKYQNIATLFWLTVYELCGIYISTILK